MSGDIKTLRCERCGKDINEIAARGAYLARTSPKGPGQIFKGVCAPSCDSTGSAADALRRAIAIAIAGAKLPTRL